MFRKSRKVYCGRGLAAFGASLVLSVCASMSNAAITVGGNDDVSPSNPAAWTYSTNGRIGYTVTTGVATLDITDGSDVYSSICAIGRNASVSGKLIVDGSGSTFTQANDLYAGYSGNGTLEVTNGATVTTTGEGYIADQSGSTGAITIDGNNSSWTTGQTLKVGVSGNGSLDIQNGATVTAGLHGYIGRYVGSTGAVVVNGTNSSWTIDDKLYVGLSGNATFNVENGSEVSNGDNGYIGRYSNSTSTVMVSGAGSTWTNSSYLYVGVEGNGSLNISGGAEVSNVDHGYIGYYSNSSGDVNVNGDGSIWENDSNLVVGYGGSGTLAINGGGLVTVGGTLYIDYSNQGGEINMRTGGQLALYGGDSTPTLTEFLALITGTDDINYWDNVAEDWDDITNATLNDDYTLEYFTTGDLAGYTLFTVGEITDPLVLLLGDANRDGVVSSADYASVQANFGNTGAVGIPGDANLDGVVSGGDYSSVQFNFGNVLTEGVAAVPEPATISLLAMGGIAMLRSRRK